MAAQNFDDGKMKDWKSRILNIHSDEIFYAGEHPIDPKQGIWRSFQAFEQGCSHMNHWDIGQWNWRFKTTWAQADFKSWIPKRESKSEKQFQYMTMINKYTDWIGREHNFSRKCTELATGLCGIEKRKRSKSTKSEEFETQHWKKREQCSDGRNER